MFLDLNSMYSSIRKGLIGGGEEGKLKRRKDHETANSRRLAVSTCTSRVAGSVFLGEIEWAGVLSIAMSGQPRGLPGAFKNAFWAWGSPPAPAPSCTAAASPPTSPPAPPNPPHHHLLHFLHYRRPGRAMRSGARTAPTGRCPAEPGSGPSRPTCPERDRGTKRGSPWSTALNGRWLQTDLLEGEGAEFFVPLPVPFLVLGPAQEEAGGAAAIQRVSQRAGRGVLPQRRQRIHTGGQDAAVAVHAADTVITGRRRDVRW